MKLILFKAPVTFAALYMLAIVFASTVHAQSATPTPTPTATPVVTSTVTRHEVVCETSAYGARDCRTIVREIPIYKTENTGVPALFAMTIALLAIFAGSTYVVTTRK
jgi:hypothetical protein